jgi:outer membrane protein assembly factor BamD
MYSASEFYMRTRRYLAAITNNELLIDRYPETEWAERALVNNIEAYILYADNSVTARQAERYQKAIDTYETYLQVFPRGENRSRAEDLFDRAKVSLDRVGTSDDSTASSE